MSASDVALKDARLSDLLEKAIVLATAAHAGQRDRYGRPYLLHPLHLMLQMDTDEERIVAILHDVVEDSETTLEDLSAAGFPPRLVHAVGLLTHDKATESYGAYIARLKQDPLARRVKLADLKHNMDLRRLPALTEQDLARLARYHRAWRDLATEEPA
jgi:(p)ppGpp synthase/HD superfamily hydrolase